MFDTVVGVGSTDSAPRRSGPALAQGFGGRDQDARRPGLTALATRSAPIVRAAARLLEVSPELAELLPEGGLRRGSTVAVEVGAAPGSVSLTLSLLASASVAGAWCAAVAIPDLGLVAAEELGVALERLALVPWPGEQWSLIVAALIESVDIVVLRPPSRVRRRDASRLTARARERGAVLVVLDGATRTARWPEGADVRLEVTGSSWSGLGSGCGHLQGRDMTVTVTGRRGATRPRSGSIRLPADMPSSFLQDRVGALDTPAAQVG